MLQNYGEVLAFNPVEYLYEVYYVIAVVILATIAGLVPALKAYRTPVATNLVAT